MRKYLIILLLLATSTFAIHANGQNHRASVSARVGYGFNYNALAYGASLTFPLNENTGITGGFDGYYFPNMYTTLSDGTITKLTDHSFPLWNARFGLSFLIGEGTAYFAFGAMYGQWNIDKPNLINMRDNSWFSSIDKVKDLVGGYITFTYPLKRFGIFIDIAATNKTGFNASLGANILFDIKK